MTLIGQAVLLVEGMRAAPPGAARSAASEPAAGRPAAARRPHGRPADRAVDLPGGVRLRRPAVPHGLRAGADRRRRLGGAGLRPDLDRPRRRARRRRLLLADPRRDQPDRRPRVRARPPRTCRSTSPRRPASSSRASRSPAGPLALGAVSGLLIGTVGFAAEWGWSQFAMPFPWTADLLPEALIRATVAARRRRPRSARCSRCALRGELPRPAVARRRRRRAARDRGACRRRAVDRPRPRTSARHVTLHDQATAARSARSARPSASTPRDAADDPPGSTSPPGRAAAWWSTGSRATAPASTARRADPGPRRLEGARSGSSRPRDRSASRSTCPRTRRSRSPRCRRRNPSRARSSTTRQLLQREQKQDVPGWLTTVAPLVVLAIALGFLATLAWGLGAVSRRRPAPQPPARASSWARSRPTACHGWRSVTERRY